MSFLPTIKDVAKAAGVHFTTVSMALRGDPRLREKTRNRILAAALRMGYRRNPVSAALTRRRRPTSVVANPPRIAYLANRSPENGFYSPAYVRALLKGAHDKAQALGYGFEVLFVDRGHYDSRLLYNYLRKNAINGIIIGAFDPARQKIELKWDEFCVVQLDSRYLQPAFTLVSNNQMHAVRLAFQKLRALGYRRIGLAVGANDDIVTANLSACGYLLEQTAVRKNQRVEPLFFPSNISHAAVAEIQGSWIKRESIDAVVCNWGNILELLRIIKIDCPEEVACACTCLMEPAPGLAGVVGNFELVGSQLTRMLAALLQAEQYGIPEMPTNSYIEGIWHAGASAPARN
jgi:LacI family transcriptional regulator